MKIVAIDFEHAGRTDHPVSIGIVEYENGIKSEFYSLINPEINDETWNLHTIKVHGISPSDVQSAPTFHEIWPEIRNRISNSLLVFHNESVEMNVLKRNLLRYSLDFDSIYFIDSLEIAKIRWESVSGYGLKNLAEMLNIDFIHHNALADAKACLEVFLHATEEITGTSPDLFSFDFQGKKVASRVLSKDNLDSWTPNTGFVRPRIQNVSSVEELGFDLKPEGALQGLSFKFTGTLQSMTQGLAQQVVLALGGSIVENSVSRNLDYLVCGYQDPKRLRDGNTKSSSELRAEALNSAGANIALLNEEQFLDLIQDS